MQGSTGHTFLKYLLVQIPGWVLLFGLLTLLRSWIAMPGWLMAGLVAAWVVKDLALFPYLRHAFEDGPHAYGADRLIGQQGVVTQALAPQGYVRVRGELWRAEGAAPETIPEGGRVRVSGASGLTLFVEPDRGEA